MKKLLLGAMLAAACITTDVNAGILGIRTASDKQEVETILKNHIGDNYVESSTEVINHINDLKTVISTIKKDKNNKTILKSKIQIVDGKKTKTKTANKILDDILKESKKISEFFKYMIDKKSKTDIAKKGTKATEAANALNTSLTALTSSDEVWSNFKDKLRNPIVEIADKLHSLATGANEGVVKKLDAKTLLTNLSNSFEAIRENVFGEKKTDTNVSGSSVENQQTQGQKGASANANSQQKTTKVDNSPKNQQTQDQNRASANANSTKVGNSSKKNNNSLTKKKL